MFVGETSFVELGFELFLKDFCKQVFELAVIRLEDRVLGAEIYRILALQTVVDAVAGLLFSNT